MSHPSSPANQTTVQDIPLDRWLPFLAEFTRENRGAHARLEIVGAGADVGYGVPTEDRPFDGVAADIKDRERSVWITFGGSTADHITHGIHGVQAVRTLPPAWGPGAVLEIETADGTKTILYLTTPSAYALAPSEPR